MKEAAKKMLQKIGIKCKDVFIALGLEQEFFVVPKSAYQQRQDLRYTGRTLIGSVGAKNQQFSDHYYAKLPHKIEDILKEVEGELLEIGIPFKTKHNEVANNQFEFCAIYEDAGKAIDHNLITMEILKEVFDKHGYTVLLHEKPFKELNGSGKHANWSINYVD
jgi:glutamine synthetase